MSKAGLIPYLVWGRYGEDSGAWADLILAKNRKGTEKAAKQTMADHNCGEPQDQEITDVFECDAYIRFLLSSAYGLDIPQEINIVNVLREALQPQVDPWSENEGYPRSDWKAEVAAGDTTLGYQEWVMHQIESNSED